MTLTEKQGILLALTTLLKHQAIIAHMVAGNNFYDTEKAQEITTKNAVIAKRVTKLME